MKRILSIALFLTGMAYAVPAYQGEIGFKQHDGSTFKGHIKGDEYFSWVEDKQGNIIKFNKKSKDYEYAKLKTSSNGTELVPSGIKVNKKPAMSNGSSFNLPKISKEKLLEIWSNKKSKVKYHH